MRATTDIAPLFDQRDVLDSIRRTELMLLRTRERDVTVKTTHRKPSLIRASFRGARDVAHVVAKARGVEDDHKAVSIDVDHMKIIRRRGARAAVGHEVAAHGCLPVSVGSARQ